MKARARTAALLVLLFKGNLFALQTPNLAAVVNGQSILLKDVESAASAEFARLDWRKAQFDLESTRERQAVLETALGRLIEERLLAAEASRRGISVERLLELEVTSTAAAPTDEDVARFFAANEQWLQGPLSENVTVIRKLLLDSNYSAMKAAYVERLKTDSKVSSLLEPLRIDLVTDNRPSKGASTAPVTVVEFSDFECPYCGALFPTLQRLASEYIGSVRIVYLQFPLADIHRQALKAAEASLCAFEQGKFWEMHDAMFKDQAHLELGDLKQKASAAMLNRTEFDLCLDSGKFFAVVRADVEQGTRAGVSGTPALFINGRMLVGNQPYDKIRQIVEDELNRLSGSESSHRRVGDR